MSPEIDTSIYSDDFGLKFFHGFMQGPFLLFNSGLYTSCLKLLLSAIDTAAFLKYENNTGAEFKKWLNEYMDLGSLGVSCEEIWEHRNALLHMTNLFSNAVKKGKVAFLVPRKDPVTKEQNDRMKHLLKQRYGSNFKIYSIDNFFQAMATGLDKFVKDIDSNPDLKKIVEANFGKIVPEISRGKFN